MRRQPFREKVLSVVAQIPAGKTLTYKEVAEQVGHPRAYRVIGNLLSKNHDPAIPCHRVIRSDGTVGGYNRGTLEKIRRLKKEAVQLRSLTPFL